jgi:hypothetical protein
LSLRLPPTAGASKYKRFLLPLPSSLFLLPPTYTINYYFNTGGSHYSGVYFLDLLKSARSVSDEQSPIVPQAVTYGVSFSWFPALGTGKRLE